jgi:exosortase
VFFNGDVILSSSQKNKRTQDSSERTVKLTKRYSTRQIMELTEKRRQHMLEEEERLAKLTVPSAVEPPKTDHPQNDPPVIDALIEKIVFPQEQENIVVEPAIIQPVKEIEPKVVEHAILDGKAVAGLFRAQPENPTEEVVSHLIKQEFNKAVEHAAPAAELREEVLSVPEVQEKKFERVERPAAPVKVKSKNAGQPKLPSKILLRFMEAAFIVTTFVFLNMMMTHLLNVGWRQHYYDQAPFVFMMTLSIAWINRKNFVRRKEWFWGSAMILAGGIGVFLAAAIDGRAYIELAGFLIVCFSLFLWRYEEASACRLIFPLSCLLFIFAPPGAWEQATIAPLNEAVFRASEWIMNSMHIPVVYDGAQFHVSGGSIISLGDPTAFRSIAAAAVLASACMSFQSMAISWSFALFLSVVFWAVLGNIIRIMTTGLMLDNFGVEYASLFFTEYSVIVVMFVMLAGLALTSGMLPHKEE